MEIFVGPVRKIAVALVLGEVIGWFLMIVGFGFGSREANMFQYRMDDPSFQSSYPLWTVSLCGPPLFLVSLFHAALGNKPGHILGMVAAFFSVIFISALGMIVYIHGEVICFNGTGTRYGPEDSFPTGGYSGTPGWFKLQFAAGMLSLAFRTILMMLWPLYEVKFNAHGHDYQPIS